jgi:hypothetical protein
MRKITNEEAVQRIKNKHPHLDCSVVKYTGAFDPVTVRCTVHDHTFSTPYKYIVSKRSKSGCIHCQRDSYRLDDNTVISRFVKKHGKKYAPFSFANVKQDKIINFLVSDFSSNILN